MKRTITITMYTDGGGVLDSQTITHDSEFAPTYHQLFAKFDSMGRCPVSDGDKFNVNVEEHEPEFD